MHMIQQNKITMLPLTIRMLHIFLGMGILSILLGMIILSIVSRQKARRILHARCPGTAWCLASSQRRSATETTLWASGSPRSSCRRSPTRARRPGPRWRGRRKPRGSTPRTRAECSATSVGSRCGSGATFRPASAGATPCVATVRNVGTSQQLRTPNASARCSLNNLRAGRYGVKSFFVPADLIPDDMMEMLGVRSDPELLEKVSELFRRREVRRDGPDALRELCRSVSQCVQRYDPLQFGRNVLRCVATG